MRTNEYNETRRRGNDNINYNRKLNVRTLFPKEPIT